MNNVIFRINIAIKNAIVNANIAAKSVIIGVGEKS